MNRKLKQYLGLAVGAGLTILLAQIAGDVALAAAYVPLTIITSKAMGNGAANIATWRAQNTGGAGTFYIPRTCIFVTPTAARTITIEQGSTAADTTAQKILDATALTANVPYQINGWFTVQNNDYFEGFANNTDINGAAYGYNYS